MTCRSITCCSRGTAPWLLCRIRRKRGDDRRQRIAQLVAEHRQELVLGAARRLQLAEQLFAFGVGLARPGSAARDRSPPGPPPGRRGSWRAAGGRSPARESGGTTRRSTAAGSTPGSGTRRARRRAPAAARRRRRARRRPGDRRQSPAGAAGSLDEIRKGPVPRRRASAARDPRADVAGRRRVHADGRRARKRRHRGVAFIESPRTGYRRWRGQWSPASSQSTTRDRWRPTFRRPARAACGRGARPARDWWSRCK